VDHFSYRDNALHAESVAVTQLAETYGTPLYVYSRATLERHWHAFNDAFSDRPHLVCFAVKANSNLAVLNVLARLGSGFDIVSVGELERVIAAGGDPARVVFSGVGKRADEMDRALEAGIRCFNVESAGELERLNDAAAAHGVVAPVSFRVNPDVDAGTHPYISTGLRENKFGIHMEEALSLYLQAAEMENIRITGVDCHIGSQLTRLDPFLDALDRVLALVDRLEREGIAIDHLDLGGGLGVRYTDESPPPPADYARAIHDRLRDMPFELLLEPGRAIAANAGILVTRVEYVKDTPDKHFTVVDAAMNDLLHPSLYQSVQQIIPVTPVPGRDPVISDIVGPVCETGDFLGKDRSIAAVPGELLAVRSSGAYGFTMSSNYNTRPRAAEVMVDGEEVHLVRHRESLASLWEGESILP